MIQVIIGSVLFIVIFLGLAFILNMLLRRTWLMSILYPIIIFLVVGGVNVFKYITNPANAFSLAIENVMKINTVDIIIFAAGLRSEERRVGKECRCRWALAQWEARRDRERVHENREREESE